MPYALRHTAYGYAAAGVQEICLPYALCRMSYALCRMPCAAMLLGAERAGAQPDHAAAGVQQSRRVQRLLRHFAPPTRGVLL